MITYLFKNMGYFLHEPSKAMNFVTIANSIFKIESSKS